ncbi:hypothetical protein L596_030802 [Steinernema carpocapsae]|uniref:Uncharacterized protein n=1 Tax=Steinernema carpocapsae TaxID=34508 RepID=A0A4U5LNT3_STECR|nr:hypothetical protein L596_030802 [Steinernema carpocapsae]
MLVNRLKRQLLPLRCRHRFRNLNSSLLSSARILCKLQLASSISRRCFFFAAHLTDDNDIPTGGFKSATSSELSRQTPETLCAVY